MNAQATKKHSGRKENNAWLPVTWKELIRPATTKRKRPPENESNQTIDPDLVLNDDKFKGQMVTP